MQLETSKRIRAEKGVKSFALNIDKLFNEDQLYFLQRGTMRGSRWQDKTIRQALKLRLSSGTSGYRALRDMGYPIPSERTLQERIEDITFSPGMLMEIFPSLRLKVATMNEFEKEAALLVDEMAIMPSLDWDPSLGVICGRPTLPLVGGKEEKVANHTLVFMVTGISSRWKQTIAYHLTGHSLCAGTMKQFMFELIRMCEEIGLKISVVISDMGGNNQAVMRQCGITIGRYCKTTNSCEHPSGGQRRLFFYVRSTTYIEKHLKPADK